MEPMSFDEFLLARKAYADYCNTFNSVEPASVAPAAVEPVVVPPAPAQDPVQAPPVDEGNGELDALKAQMAAQAAQIEQLKLLSSPSLASVEPRGIEDIVKKILS